MRILRLTVAIALFLTLSPGNWGQEKQATTNKSNVAQPPPSTSPESLVIGNQNFGSTEEKDCSKEKTQNWVQWFWPPFWSNWALVVAAIWAGRIGLKTLRAIREQSAATESSAEATLKSVKLQETTFVQWVILENWKVEEVSGTNDIEIQFDITNPTSFPLTLDIVSMELLRRPRQNAGPPTAKMLAPHVPYGCSFTYELVGKQVERYKRGMIMAFDCDILYRTVIDKKQGQRISGSLWFGKGQEARFNEWLSTKYDSTPDDEKTD